MCKNNYSNYNINNSNLNNIDNFINNKINEYENYEKKYYSIVHKKQTCDYYLAYINGISCYLYFTKSLNRQNITNKLYLIIKKNNVFSIKTINIVCDDNLFNGTLIKGVLYNNINNIKNNKEIKYFQYEQLIYYNHNIFNKTYTYGLNIYSYILNNYVKHNSFGNNFINLRLPLIDNNINNLFNVIHLNKYNIRNIVYVNKLYKYSQKWNNNLLKIDNKKILIVKPDIQNDIYKLYYIKNNEETFLDYAYVMSYEQSVMLNNIFRIIKENENLDLLEESDSEDEFENINIDKYVKLDKKVIMECELNKRFKRWMPIKILYNTVDNNNIKYVYKL